MDNRILTKVNRSISHWMLFLTWEVDELAVLFNPFIVFFAVKEPHIGLIIGFILLKFYSKIKYNKPVGYLNHMLIKKGLIPLKKLPPSHYKIYYK